MNSHPRFAHRHDYETALLRLLCDLPEEKGKANNICRLFEKRYGDRIPENDHVFLEKAQQTRWMKHVNWCRYNLSKRGFVDSPQHGIWRLTEQGRQWARDNPDEGVLPPVQT